MKIGEIGDSENATSLDFLDIESLTTDCIEETGKIGWKEDKCDGDISIAPSG